MWEKKYNKLLTLWLNQISQNHRAHHMASVSSGRKQLWMGLLIIFFSVVASFTSFINISDFSKKAQKIITISSGALAMISAVLTGLDKFLYYGGESQKHKTMSDEYAGLSADIQMTLCSSDPPNPDDFFRNITERLNVIQRFSPCLLDNEVSLADLPNLNLIKKNEIFLSTDEDPIPELLDI